uniref:Teneurin NHL domain-containing protein n=1 Tax=viral metagenome TaxID=1070528 RepID=A0A6C0D8L4_9ZZZZ
MKKANNSNFSNVKDSYPAENSNLENKLETSDFNSKMPVENSHLENQLESPEQLSKVKLLRSVAVPNTELDNVIKDIEYLTSLGLTKTSNNEAMKNALNRYIRITGSEYVFPLPSAVSQDEELIKIRNELAYLTSLGLTENSDNETMKSALSRFRQITGYGYFSRAPAPSIITTLAGTGVQGFSGDGRAGLNASFNSLSGVAVDRNGNLFIADAGNHRIRRVAAGTGIITTVAGNGTAGFSGDGGAGSNASLNYPIGVAVDGAGNLFIADTNNQRIRRVDTSGIITTVAGSGPTNIERGPYQIDVNAFSGDQGAATSARLAFPHGVAVDGAGNIFIADFYNQRIRRVDTSGIITTVAGSGPNGYPSEAMNFTGDGGPARNARLYFPSGIAVDTSGNIFFISAARILRVDVSGNITSVAGNGTNNFSGDGGPSTSAAFRFPQAVAVDGRGNVLIADTYNQRIRRVDMSGIITTVVGTGGVSIDASGNLVNFDNPSGIALDTSGNLFIADSYTNKIYKVNNLLPAQATRGGRRRRNKKSRRVKKSRELRKSRRVRKSKN